MRQAFALVSGVEGPEETRTEGYYANPIKVLRTIVQDQKDIAAFWRKVKEAGELDRVIGTLSVRVDRDCILHLRFDKQEAFFGRLRLVDHDDVVSVKGKVASYPAKRERALEVGRAYLEKV